MDQELLKAVLDVNAAADALGVKAVLVGALMMEFAAEIKPDYPLAKRTNDADFAVFVDDWDSFGRLLAGLEGRGYRRSAKVEHRLMNDVATVSIDLVPVGDRIAPAGRIVWPESQQEMTVIGFEEACGTLAKEVRPGLPMVPVITVAGFVLLKAIAFQERFERQDLKYQNDVEHLVYWFEHYASISETDDRRFDLAAEKGWQDLDVAFAGAALLGRDVAALCSLAARRRIQRFLAESGEPYSPFVDTVVRLKRSMATGDEAEAMRIEAIEWIRAFRRGFESELIA